MSQLIKAEGYKFRQEKSVWIISVILIACACISIFTNVYDSAEDTFANLGKDAMILYLACAVYAGLSIADEFENRTVIHIIAFGYSRLQFMLAKLLHYFGGCALIAILYLVVSAVIAAIALGLETSLPMLVCHIAWCLLAGAPIYFCMAMFFFLFVILVRKGTLAIAGSVSFSILSVVFSNKAYFSRPLPERSWLRLLPAIQLPQIYEGSVVLSDYLFTCIISAAGISLLFFVCAVLIRKAEL